MPYASKAQEKLFLAAEHNSKFAKKVGVSQTVAKKFNKDSKGKIKKVKKK